MRQIRGTFPLPNLPRVQDCPLRECADWPLITSRPDHHAEPYLLAQRALADLKFAVYATLKGAPAKGLTNAQLGHSLGIYHWHVGHEGHISRTILGMLKAEGLAHRDEATKSWSLQTHTTEPDTEG